MVHMMDEYDFESNDDFLLLMPFGKAVGHCATVRAVTPMRMACAPRVGPRAVMCPQAEAAGEYTRSLALARATGVEVL